MKKLKLAVFDLDGVLLDSMGIWQEVGDRFLEQNGIELTEEIRKKINTYTVEKVAEYLNSRYHLRKDDEEIVREICGAVEEAYDHTIPTKPYVEQALRWLSEHGVRLCILTASERYFVESACRRLDILKYFERLYTCTEIGRSKYETACFAHVLQEMGAAAEEAVMFEDSIHALLTAGKAGMHTAAVEDAPWNEENLTALRENGEWYIDDYRKLPVLFENAVE